MYGGVGDGDGDAGADVVAFVAAEVARVQGVSCFLQGLGEVAAAVVFLLVAGVADGEDVDAEGAEIRCGHGVLSWWVGNVVLFRLRWNNAWAASAHPTGNGVAGVSVVFVVQAA